MRDLTIAASLAAGLLIAATDATPLLRSDDSSAETVQTEADAQRAPNDTGEAQNQQRARQIYAEHVRIERETREREVERDLDRQRAAQLVLNDAQ
jgi:hypothetical protein